MNERQRVHLTGEHDDAPTAYPEGGNVVFAFGDFDFVVPLDRAASLSIDAGWAVREAEFDQPAGEPVQDAVDESKRPSRPSPNGDHEMMSFFSP